MTRDAVVLGAAGPLADGASSMEPPAGAFTTIMVGAAPLVRAALASLLVQSGAFEVVAFADGSEEALRYANGHKPDLAIVGPYVAGISSLAGDDGDGHQDLVAAIRRASDSTRVCMVVDADHGVKEMASGLDAGAHGVVSVDSNTEEFIAAAIAIASGSVHLPPALAVRLLSAQREEAQAGLSPRETEVLRNIALGYTNTEIAALLHLSVRTIETHRGNISAKLGTTTRAELVRWAIDRALLR